MMSKFNVERSTTLNRLLANVPEVGTVKRETLAGMISAAFDGGILAGLNKSLEIVNNSTDADKIRELLGEGRAI